MLPSGLRRWQRRGGRLAQLVNVMVSRGVAAFMSGDLTTAGMLDDQLLRLALREGSPTAWNLRISGNYLRGLFAAISPVLKSIS